MHTLISHKDCNEEKYCSKLQAANFLCTSSVLSLYDPVWEGKDCSSGNSCCFEPSLPIILSLRLCIE